MPWARRSLIRNADRLVAPRNQSREWRAQRGTVNATIARYPYVERTIHHQ